MGARGGRDEAASELGLAHYLEHMLFEARAGAQASASPVQPRALASAPKRVVLKVVPEKVVSWDHRKLGGRY